MPPSKRRRILSPPSLSPPPDSQSVDKIESSSPPASPVSDSVSDNQPITPTADLVPLPEGWRPDPAPTNASLNSSTATTSTWDSVFDTDDPSGRAAKPAQHARWESRKASELDGEYSIESEAELSFAEVLRVHKWPSRCDRDWSTHRGPEPPLPSTSAAPLAHRSQLIAGRGLTHIRLSICRQIVSTWHFEESTKPRPAHVIAAVVFKLAGAKAARLTDGVSVKSFRSTTFTVVPCEKPSEKFYLNVRDSRIESRIWSREARDAMLASILREEFEREEAEWVRRKAAEAIQSAFETLLSRQMQCLGSYPISLDSVARHFYRTGDRPSVVYMGWSSPALSGRAGEHFDRVEFEQVLNWFT